ncbi:hydroxymyristoyl-ACP dehydratase [Flavobacteriaceae bacterium]|nr:hydroxymyristoyl-ACP dehydratase [Flavobacteriaceae bacterium]MDB3913761.1 hydroxymyristoyl-ACP dehydratase [Flavobacteriaceae bacterium]MDB4496060.1 hydroxymyristoyl-ACP dehydratase [Flavobacteriaceae bacterium]MDB4560547.1 hydroxymyristoyl-ACP dehydratase [Flavobacteriaceae bacterium]MDC1168502.1 FabA/FabZ family ACP-dehydratase [Flavobacteriaceae bacterium]
MNHKNIIRLLPYQAPFLFVDEVMSLSELGTEGCYTFKEDEYFYQGHFKDNPITPGVILTEVMAQIGVVCLGIYLLRDEISTTKKPQIALTSNHIDFFLPVYPKERVKVVSEKIYFRFNKLKCKVELFNEKNELVCRGTISGMLKSMNNEA